MSFDLNIAKEILRLRLSMMIINEKFKKNAFKIPIHLALGHESIAIAVSNIMDKEDQLVLSHRNVHYNIARTSSLKLIIDEYLLRKEGVGGAKLGSMNLANEKEGVAYTSSILGNNLSVAAGLALGKKVKGTKGCVIAVTGDGAMEEGTFFECLEFLRFLHLAVIVIVENNGWSLATQIHERRGPIDLNLFSKALDVDYIKLEGNDPFKYIKTITEIRSSVIANECPVVIEVNLNTLGDWRLKTDEYPDGKFINYHAGPAPTVEISSWPLIKENENDPVYVLTKSIEQNILKKNASDILEQLNEEIL